MTVSREKPDILVKAVANMRKHGSGGAGGCCAAFGVGLLVATVFPPEFMLIFAAAALVVLGCSRVCGR